jgi:hypothetical protein
MIVERHGVMSVILKGKKFFYCGEQGELSIGVFEPQDSAN